MSKLNIAAFWQKVEQDQELRERLESIPQESRDKAMVEVVRIAAELDLPFTAEELVESGKETTDGLTNDELESVAGGVGVLGGKKSVLTNALSRGIGTVMESRGHGFKSSFFNKFRR